MRRDLDLIRELLLKFEQLPLNGGLNSREIELPPWVTDVIVYHCGLLNQAGLIEARDAGTLAYANYIVIGLRWEGHDYLDAVRSETIWRKVNDRLREEGISATLETAKALATALAMKTLGLG